MKHNSKEKIGINADLAYFSTEQYLRVFTEQKEQKIDAGETLDREEPML